MWTFVVAVLPRQTDTSVSGNVSVSGTVAVVPVHSGQKSCRWRTLLGKAVVARHSTATVADLDEGMAMSGPTCHGHAAIFFRFFRNLEQT